MYDMLKNAYRKALVTDHPLVLTLANLRQPQRIIRLAMYDQVIGRLPLISKTRPAKAIKGPIDQAFVDHAHATIDEKGIVVFPGLFADVARQLRERYMRAEKDYEAFDRYERTFFNPTCNQLISSFILREEFLVLAAKYMRCQPYLRLGPSLAVLKPEHTTVAKLGVPHGLEESSWHIDTPTLFGFHLILNDTTAANTRMRYAIGSHKVRRSVSGVRSEESVEARYDIVDCIGPAGTLYIFDHNGLHRKHAVAGSLRATFEFYYTAGNQCFSVEQMRWSIEVDKKRGKPDRQVCGEGMQDAIHLNESMSPIQREALREMIEKKDWTETENSRARGNYEALT